MSGIEIGAGLAALGTAAASSAPVIGAGLGTAAATGAGLGTAGALGGLAGSTGLLAGSTAIPALAGLGTAAGTAAPIAGAGAGLGGLGALMGGAGAATIPALETVGATIPAFAYAPAMAGITAASGGPTAAAIQSGVEMAGQSLSAAGNLMTQLGIDKPQQEQAPRAMPQPTNVGMKPAPPMTTPPPGQPGGVPAQNLPQAVGSGVNSAMAGQLEPPPPPPAPEMFDPRKKRPLMPGMGALMGVAA